ncbi:MAG: hypothetical protein PHU43_08410 [Candidatus Bipolaricaulis sp.]|nr:hypothetical protein [Candidatus Bipolaricaulis sp.]
MDNTTLIAVLVGALVAGLALLFLVGAPSDGTAVAEPVAPAPATASAAGTYWEPMSTAALPSPVVTSPTLALSAPAATPPAYPVGYEPSVHCPACMASQALPASSGVVLAPTPALVGGCGTPIEPCGAPACRTPSCGAPSCALNSYGTPSCGPAAPSCRVGCPGAGPCQPACGLRPQINRNTPLCVDECSFIQLHASVPQPVCRTMRFEWSASKGYFLDPTAGDPIYYAPTTYFPGGEEVWVTLTLTDAQGVRYTDQVELHVNNVR